MTATLQDILRWLDEAKQQGARWLIVAVDRFDWENYPIYVMPNDSFWEQFPSGDMQGVDEVYDMEMDLDEQKAERRAYHPPLRRAVKRIGPCPTCSCTCPSCDYHRKERPCSCNEEEDHYRRRRGEDREW